MKFPSRKLWLKYHLLKLFRFFISGKKYPAPVREQIRKVLIIRQDNRIGNLLFVTPLLQLINEELGVKPDVICGGAFNEIFSDNPLVGQVLIYNQKEFIKKPWRFISFLRSLHKSRYDLVIDCKKVFSFNNALLTMMSKRHRIGFKNPVSSLYLDAEFDLTGVDHTVHESILLALPAAAMLGVDNSRIPFMSYQLKPLNLQLPDNFIAMHIGGRGNKSIPVELVNELCRELLKSYDGKLAVIYGPDEEGKAGAVIMDSRIVKVRPSGINELAYWISNAKLFITPDTGPLHVASALNQKIAAIFSVTPSISYGPRSKSASLVLNPVEKTVPEMAEGILKLLKQHL